MPHSNSGRGFTLIEILIVVALLGILAGLVAPLIGESRRDAMRSAVRTQLAIVRGQLDFYALCDDGDVPPRGTEGPTDLQVFWKLLIEHKTDGPRLPRVPELPDGFAWVWNGHLLHVRYTGTDERLSSEAQGW